MIFRHGGTRSERILRKSGGPRHAQSKELHGSSGSGQPAPFGMVVLSEDGREQAKNKSNRADMAASLDAHRSTINAQLDHHEALKMLVVIGEEWTIDNGKLKISHFHIWNQSTN